MVVLLTKFHIIEFLTVIQSIFLVVIFYYDCVTFCKALWIACVWEVIYYTNWWCRRWEKVIYKLFSTWSSSAPLWLIVLTLIVLQRPIWHGLFLQHYTVFRCFFHFLNSKMRTFFSLGIWILKWFAQIYASERVENSNGVDKPDAVCFVFKNEKNKHLHTLVAPYNHALMGILHLKLNWWLMLISDMSQ